MIITITSKPDLDATSCGIACDLHSGGNLAVGQYAGPGACDSQTAINGVKNLYPCRPGAALKARSGMHF